MKKLFLFIAILASLTTQAQQLSTDSNIGQMVAPIQPIAVSGLDSTYDTRITFEPIGLSFDFITIRWHIQYAYVKDSSSIYWYDDKVGTFTLPLTGNLTNDESKMGIALYTQQHATLNNRKLKFSYQ